MQWSPLRLVLKRWKALYVALAYLVAFVLARLLSGSISSESVGAIAALVDILWIYYATRIFRGPEEILVAPRPWWQLTAKPRAGFVIGWILVGLSAAWTLMVLAGRLQTIALILVAEASLIGVFYLNSSFRLRKIFVSSVSVRR